MATENIRQGGSTGPNSAQDTDFHRGAYPTMDGTVKAEQFVAAKASHVYQHKKSRLKRPHEESHESPSKGEAFSERRVQNGDDLYCGDDP